MLFCLKVDKEFFLVCVCLLHGRLTFLMLHSIIPTYVIEIALYMPADTDIRT